MTFIHSAAPLPSRRRRDAALAAAITAIMHFRLLNVRMYAPRIFILRPLYQIPAAGARPSEKAVAAKRQKLKPKTQSPHFHQRRRFGIIVSVMLKQEFRDFIFSTNTDGSGKASSCVRALDMLGPILTKHCPKPIVGGSRGAYQRRNHVLHVAEKGIRTDGLRVYLCASHNG